ncbi:hypothetical protein [Paenibacillus antri]|uniref:hypothetical protein n=1 Tax=Paenibacillus antri TaxID=2582848 RepID=UPI0026860A44
MLDFISPMLLEIAPAPFDDERYVFQPKIDGHRAIITCYNGEIRIFTRHGNEVMDLRKEPLTERQRTIVDVYDESPAFRSLLTVDGTGKAMFDAIKTRNMEGVVAKRKGSVYVSERSPNWLQIINWTYADVYITGWRKQKFGWLAAVYGDGGKLRPAGVI